MTVPLISSSGEDENRWRQILYNASECAKEPGRIYSRVFVRVLAPWKLHREELLQSFKEALSDAPELALLKRISQKEIGNPFCRSKVAEVAVRLLLGTTLVIAPLVGMEILRIPVITQVIQGLFFVSAFGLVLQSATSLFDKKNYCFRRAVDFRRDQKEGAGSIGSWNVGQLPVFAPLHVGAWQSLTSAHYLHVFFRKMGFKSYRSETRLERQVQVLRDLQTDIIALQECSPLQADYLRKKIGYPFAYMAVGNHPLKGSSGLTLFSKTHLKNFSFHPFKKKAGINRLANRGFAFFTAEVGGVNSRVYVAHLNPRSADCRQAQLEQIIAHAKKSIEGAECNRTILVGDLNLSSEKEATDREWYGNHFETTSMQTVTCTNLLQFMNSWGNKSVVVESIDRIGVYIGDDPDQETPEEKLAGSAHSSSSVRQEHITMVQVTLDSLASSDHFPIIRNF